MYASAFPVAFVYFFLWNPPALSEFWLFVYLTVASVLVRFFITLYEIPSSAIVAELTDDYDERTRMLGYRYMMGWYGGLAMAVLNWGVLMVAWGAGSELGDRLAVRLGRAAAVLRAADHPALGQETQRQASTRFRSCSARSWRWLRSRSIGSPGAATTGGWASCGAVRFPPPTRRTDRALFPRF